QSGTATITVNPLPTATISGTTAVCQNGTQPNITFTGAGGTAPYTFIYKINGGTNQTVTTTSGNSVTVAAPTATTGTFAYTLVSVQDASTTACVQTQSGTATITVNEPVSITTPPSDATVCASFAASFSVTATGSGLTYQWYKGGTIIGGATSSTYSISHASTTDAGSYTVTVSGATGCSSVTSSPAATLIVNQLISITQPAPVEVCDNAASVSFSITANGTNPTYVWRKDGIPFDDGGNISGTKTPTLTITNPHAADAANYDVVVSVDGTGCNQIISNPAALSVDPPTVGGTASSDQFLCTGNTPKDITLSANVGNVIRWERASDASFTSPTTIAVTSTTLTGVTIGAINSSTYFRAVVQSGVCSTQYSSVVLVTVNPTPDVNGVSNQTICNTSATTAI